jgi:hypothetical protein
MFANNFASNVYSFFTTILYGRNDVLKEETRSNRTLNYFDIQIEKIDSEFGQMILSGTIDHTKSILIDDPLGILAKKIVDMDSEKSRLEVLSEIYSSRKFCGELEYTKRPSVRQSVSPKHFTSKQSKQSFKFRPLSTDPIELDEESDYDEVLLFDMFMDLPGRYEGLHSYMNDPIDDLDFGDDDLDDERGRVIFHQPLCDFNVSS